MDGTAREQREMILTDKEESLLLRDLNALLNSLYLKCKVESVRICLVVRDRNLKSNSHGKGREGLGRRR